MAASNFSPDTVIISTHDLGVTYGGVAAIAGVNLTITKHQLVALIGASGCGKSSLLRCFNRLNELIPQTAVQGRVLFQGQNIYDPDIDPVLVRRQIGMVFQRPNPFPTSIYENLAFGLRLHGFRAVGDLVEQALVAAALWDEVKDRLGANALSLSGGQQQRLCIARAIALSPQIILMDEPCSALDPVTTRHIEGLMQSLKSKFTIIMVTHNQQQAARIADLTAVFAPDQQGIGRLVELRV